MKILHVAHYYAPHIGGVERHLLGLAKQVLKQDITTTVLTRKHDQSLLTVEHYPEAVVVRIPVTDSTGFWHKFSVWKGVLTQRKYFFEADRIHVHDVFWWLVVLLPLLLLKGKKIYMTFHGYEGNVLPTAHQVFWKKVAALFTRGSICVGEFQKKWFGISPSTVVYGAVDVVTAAKKQKSKTAVFIGRLERDNGLHLYLEALRLAKEAGVMWKLDVFGEGSELQSAKAFVKRHKLSVTFHGFVPLQQEHLATYSVAFVSRYLAILEALSARVPVIAQFHNSMTEDYLKLAPFSKWISIVASAEDAFTALTHPKPVTNEAVRWVGAQTWQSLARVYTDLWNKK